MNSNQLREKYLPEVYKSEIEDLKSFFLNKKISVTIDETTDVCGKSIIQL